MKIKYYLRGLGTGILFATIILTISYATKHTKTLDSETTSQGIIEETTKETSTENATIQQTTSTNSVSDNGSINNKNVTVTVKSGMSSEEVSSMLQENGIIESATDFDIYLNEKGYSKIIAVGTYEILANSTYKEIAEAITNTN